MARAHVRTLISHTAMNRSRIPHRDMNLVAPLSAWTNNRKMLGLLGPRLEGNFNILLSLGLGLLFQGYVEGDARVDIAALLTLLVRALLLDRREGGGEIAAEGGLAHLGLLTRVAPPTIAAVELVHVGLALVDQHERLAAERFDGRCQVAHVRDRLV